MTPEEFKERDEKRDRQLDTVVSLLATLAEQISGLVRLADIQNQRITRLENAN